MDALKLRAVLGLDKKDYDEGLKNAEDEANHAGGNIGKLLGTSAKIIGAGIATASAAVGALVKSSVDAYAEYEQLVGGVETLFKNSSDAVMAYAENAYQTAGLSANEYMETVTSFSASLLQSLDGDTAAAADKADQAITDMADNANKMGTSMEMIQNAYQGFAKQNYTMLDNLKLGYGGTKEEMQRLLEDAEKISGIKYDISSYADVVDAIHVMQTEMGIAGTTAEEAEKTISGSLAMTKSAWQNLVTGITDPKADIGKLISNFVGAAGKAASNLIPAISQALQGVGQLINEIVPIIAEELPGVLEELVPLLLDTATELFTAIVDNLPALLSIIIEQLPTMIQTLVDAVVDLLPMIMELALQLVMALANGLIEAIPQLIPAITQMITDLVTLLTQPDNLTKLIMAALQIMIAITTGLVQAIPQLIQAVPQIIENLVVAIIELAPQVLLAGVQLVVSLVEGVFSVAESLYDAGKTLIQDLIETIVEVGKQLVEKGKDLVDNVINGIKSMFETIKQRGKELIDKVIDGIKSQFSAMVQKGKDVIQKVIDGIVSMFTSLVEKGKSIVENVKSGFMEKVEEAKDWGKDLIQNFIDGVLAKWESLKQTVSNVAQSVKDFLGFSEPKLGPLSNFHTYAPDMMDLFMKGINDNKDKLLDTVQNAFDFENLITAPLAGTVSVRDGAYGIEGVGGDTIYNININQPIKDATDVARALREEAQYGLLGG